MFLDADEWAPITDEDLLGDDPPPVVESASAEPLPPQKPPEPDPEPLILLPPASPHWFAAPAPPPPRPFATKKRGRRGHPVYTGADWQIFDKWVHTKGFSIDQAAACAGIDTYTAIIALQKRDPYFYELKVMVGPQGGSGLSTRRRKGVRAGLSAWTKGPMHSRGRQRVNPVRGGVSLNANRPSEEAAKLRFLAMLDGRNQNERCDGVTKAEEKEQKLIVHEVSKAVDKSRAVHFRAHNCGNCKRFGHNRRACPELKNDSTPAGSENSSTTTSVG